MSHVADLPTHVCYSCGRWFDVYTGQDATVTTYIVEHSPEGLDLKKIYEIAAGRPLTCPKCRREATLYLFLITG